MGFKSGTGCKNNSCTKTNCNDIMCGLITPCPIFTRYITPNGGLDSHKETHALFYYYLLASKALETESNQIVYEGDKDPEYNQMQILKSVAKWYAVDVHNMVNAWDAVDLTCLMHNLPKLANRFRFTNKIEIRIN